MTVFSLVSFKFLTQTLQREFDDALYNYAVDVLDSISLTPRGEFTLVKSEIDRRKVYPFSLGNALIQITHASGEIVTQIGEFGEFALPLDRTAFRLRDDQEASYTLIEDLGGLPRAEASTYRMISFPIDNTPVPQLILQIAAPRTLVERQLENRMLAFEIGIPIVLVIATLSGLFISSRALRPVRSMIQKAASISGSELSLRLPVPRVNDEIRDLSLTLNSMLDRIERSFRGQERFVADASHQLFTPLAVMKGQIEASVRENPALKETLGTLSTEVDQLSAMVKDMLVLAQIDAGVEALTLQHVNLEDVVYDALRRVERLRKESNLRIQFQLSEEQALEASIEADQDLLTHLVFNLLENALKYAQGDEPIKVSLMNPDSHSVRLTVENRGPWIGPEELVQIFDRFHRGRPSAKEIRGFGLGLSISRKIAEVHGGQLTAQSSPLNEATGVIFFHLLLPLKFFNPEIRRV